MVQNKLLTTIKRTPSCSHEEFVHRASFHPSTFFINSRKYRVWCWEVGNRTNPPLSVFCTDFKLTKLKLTFAATKGCWSDFSNLFPYYSLAKQKRILRVNARMDCIFGQQSSNLRTFIKLGMLIYSLVGLLTLNRLTIELLCLPFYSREQTFLIFSFYLQSD